LGPAFLFTCRISATIPGKKFVKDSLGLSGMEVSFNTVPPRAAISLLPQAQRQ